MFSTLEENMKKRSKFCTSVSFHHCVTQHGLCSFARASERLNPKNKIFKSSHSLVEKTKEAEKDKNSAIIRDTTEKFSAKNL